MVTHPPGFGEYFDVMDQSGLQVLREFAGKGPGVKALNILISYRKINGGKIHSSERDIWPVSREGGRKKNER